MEKGNEAAKKIASNGNAGSIEVMELDVTNDDTIEKAVSQLASPAAWP